VLEAALNQLNDALDVDYGVLLSSDNGLPGLEYFNRFIRNRRDAYVAVLGDPRYKRATVKGKWQLVTADRQRVYEHIARHSRQERECACA
jgi:polynucleotide 5'-kinase involved in rRNA processing